MNDFKYLVIVDWAKAQIKEKNLSSGDRFYSENELCDIHGVSRQTVRQALKMLENQDVIVRRRGSGTFVKAAGGAHRTQSFNVGVISTYFSDYIFPSIVTGIELVLKQRNVTMQLSITQNQVSEESRALKAMLSQDIRGLIIEPSKSALPNPNIELYEQIKARGIPVVFFNAKYPWSDFPCVAMDDVAAGRMVTDHLFELGHSKIAGIFSLDDIQGHERYKGFMQSFENHGVEDAEQSVLWYATNERKALFSRSKERVEDLLANATAVVCYNDSMAIKLLEFCRSAGINVPEDLSVVGIDDSKLSRVCEVPLTTIRHPHQELGECAAQKLLEMIDDPTAPVCDTLFAPELIIRNSTCKPK